jgi:predicted SAM-dependent methyltransferase
MIETIEFKDDAYPAFQGIGNAAQFAIPFAKHVCVGDGYDIGCCKTEWSLPGSIPIDLDFSDDWHANHLPTDLVDYIFSSHCLEHVDDWVRTLDYWSNKLKAGGTLFLYLPHKDQEYWRPWNNTKHNHMFIPTDIVSYMNDNGYKNIFYSDRDLNHSFMVMGEKK